MSQNEEEEESYLNIRGTHSRKVKDIQLINKRVQTHKHENMIVTHKKLHMYNTV